MTRRDAQRRIRRFIARYHARYVHWHLDLCEELGAFDAGRRRSWSFDLGPDEEDEEYEPGRRLVGYVHADGLIEGLY